MTDEASESIKNTHHTNAEEEQLTNLAQTSGSLHVNFFFSPVSLADRIIWKMVRMASILCAVVSRGQKAYFSLTLKYSDISVSQNIRLLLGQWWILSPDKGSERKALVIQPMIRLLVGFSCFAPFFLSK